MNRSLVAAATAALMAGPLAAAGVAASLDGALDPALDLTCTEARKLTQETGKTIYVETFCEPTASPSPKATTNVSKTVEQTRKTVNDTVTKTTSPSGGGGGEPAPTPTGPVLEPSGSGGGTPKQSAGNQPRGITDDASKKRSRSNVSAAGRQPSPVGFDANGPLAPGMRSNSSLTLQPFASPVVSGGFMYELPQIAEQLFGDTEVAGAEDPMVAAGVSSTGASPYSAAGYTSTPADANGWLAATATGLIMLVGAGHALAGGRTPKRQRA